MTYEALLAGEYPISLHAGDVARAALKLMDEGKLQLQTIEPSSDNTTPCLYDAGDGCHCAIGAAIPDELSKLLDRMDNAPIDELLDVGEFLTAPDGGHYEALSDMQQLHDGLCFAIRSNKKTLAAAVAEMREFLERTSADFPAETEEKEVA
jgi:hypothetical protein